MEATVAAITRPTIINVLLTRDAAQERAEYWRGQGCHARVMQRTVRAAGAITRVYAVVIWPKGGK